MSADEPGAEAALSDPLSVLHVIPSVAPSMGGPSTTVVMLCRTLAARGHKAEIFTTTAGGTQPPEHPIGIPTEVGGVRLTYFRRQLDITYSPSLSLVASLGHRAGSFDLIHFHGTYQFGVLTGSAVGRLRGVPYLMCPHGALDPHLRRRHALRKRLYFSLLERPLFNRAAAIHYHTEEEWRLAEPIGLVAPPAIVPAGVNLEEYAHLPAPGEFRAAHPRLADKQLVLFLSRLHEKKGLDLLAAALPSILRAVPGAHLVVAGPDSGYEATFRRLLCDHGVAGHVTFTGMLTGRAKLAALRDADLFVLPSYTENFGLAVVEALAAGLPAVISDRVNIAADLKAEGAAAVIPCDAGALASQVSALLLHPEQRQALAREGKRTVAERYTWEACAQRLEVVYRAILAGDRPDRALAASGR